MTGLPFVAALSEQPRPLNVLGERVTVLASARATGAYEIFRQDGEAGQGPPPHAHDWDETFLVIWAVVEIGIGSASRLCKAGSIAHVPAGVPHWFQFVSDGQMLSITSKAGASAFFEEVDRSVAACVPDVEHTLAIARRHGLQILVEGSAPPALASAA
jgi:quercetin dioxygenase-like cupin family protein